MKENQNGKIVIMLFFAFIFFNCQPNIKEDNDLNKLSYSLVIEKMGQPMNEIIIQYNDSISLYEYQSSLYELLKKKMIKIKELKWKKNNWTTVIWFWEVDGEWLSFSNLKWDKNVVF